MNLWWGWLGLASQQGDHWGNIGNPVTVLSKPEGQLTSPHGHQLCHFQGLLKVGFYEHAHLFRPVRLDKMPCVDLGLPPNKVVDPWQIHNSSRMTRCLQFLQTIVDWASHCAVCLKTKLLTRECLPLYVSHWMVQNCPNRTYTQCLRFLSWHAS